MNRIFRWITAMFPKPYKVYDAKLITPMHGEKRETQAKILVGCPSGQMTAEEINQKAYEIIKRWNEERSK